MKDGNLEDLLLTESKLVFKYLIKIGASKENAEDIIQETLYKTLMNIDSIEDETLRAWLFKVAINAYYNLYNKDKKHTNLSPKDIQSLAVFTETPEDYYAEKQKTQNIHRALDMIKPAYKNLLVSKYILYMSYKDISDIMEMSEEKVKVYLYRARNKFKKIWEGLNDE